MRFSRYTKIWRVILDLHFVTKGVIYYTFSAFAGTACRVVPATCTLWHRLLRFL
jgi:hypothetical protein